MLGVARRVLPGESELRVARPEDSLPGGPFDRVISALVIHHLAGFAKAKLFRRIAGVISPGGLFVLGDVIVPVDPEDAVTPIESTYDRPSSVAEQSGWLSASGFVVTFA